MYVKNFGSFGGRSTSLNSRSCSHRSSPVSTPLVSECLVAKRPNRAIRDLTVWDECSRTPHVHLVVVEEWQSLRGKRVIAITSGQYSLYNMHERMSYEKSCDIEKLGVAWGRGSPLNCTVKWKTRTPADTDTDSDASTDTDADADADRKWSSELYMYLHTLCTVILDLKQEKTPVLYCPSSLLLYFIIEMVTMLTCVLS